MHTVRRHTVTRAVSGMLCPTSGRCRNGSLELHRRCFLMSTSIRSVLRHRLEACGALGGLPSGITVRVGSARPALSVPRLVHFLLSRYNCA